MGNAEFFSPGLFQGGSVLVKQIFSVFSVDRSSRLIPVLFI
jgi:hypothetical protein